MPLYEWKCPKCGVFERYLPVEKYQEPQVCECGEPSKKILSLPTIFVKQDCHYESPIDGRPITNYRERWEDMKRSGCVEYDPGVKQDYHRRIVNEEKELDKKVDETVEREVSKMSPRKLEILESEMKSGLTVEPVRLTDNKRTL